MKQTKAAFRNKPFISLKGSILFLILIPMSGLIHAQYSMGTTGQLMIPTAEMQETGTFTGGVNFLPEQVTPSVFSFPTMNYFVDMTLFSFIEFTYRMTLLKMTTGTGRTGYHNQDRSNTIRIRPIKESRYFPAVVIGGDDLLTEKKTPYWGAYYGVLTKTESNEIFEANYRRVIGASRRFDPQDNSAIWIWNRFTDYMRTQNAMGMLRTAIWVIGIFTLLSGIVGVSNIMLITVKERTREFGIRKALGAKPLSILWLIIVESVAITTLFGYIGMVAGIAVTEWMDSAFGNQTMDAGMFQQTMFSNPTVDLSVAIQATLTLIIAGTLAGFFPAKKAVSISPIETLRAD